jgi:hypothetical protein
VPIEQIETLVIGGVGGQAVLADHIAGRVRKNPEM